MILEPDPIPFVLQEKKLRFREIHTVTRNFFFLKKITAHIVCIRTWAHNTRLITGLWQVTQVAR